MRMSSLYDQTAHVLFVQAREDQNTAYQTGTSGTHNTVDLTDTDMNTIIGASVSSNQITLPEGVYLVIAHCDFTPDGISAHGLRLMDVDNTEVLARSVVKEHIWEDTGASGAGTGMVGGFILDEETVVEAQFYNMGIGRTANISGEDEIFFSMIIVKIR
jgi:hypothetical protein